jgi:hypothetical protein
MSDLGWRAEGIERAEAAGGVTLEVYWRPGFIRTRDIRRLRGGLDGGAGFQIDADPEPNDDAEQRIRHQPM